jgi:hypothetical protein
MMANYETMKAFFDGMDDDTAQAVYQMHLNDAAELHDHEFTAMLTRAFKDRQRVDLLHNGNPNTLTTGSTLPSHLTSRILPHTLRTISHRINRLTQRNYHVTHVRSLERDFGSLNATGVQNTSFGSSSSSLIISSATS